jgi:predicted helicase
MSKLLISQYQSEVEKIISYGGTKKETTIRFAFQNLLNSYCQTRNFLLIPELPYKNQRIIPDGTVKDALQLDWGYWESKDQDDNLDVEIEKKFRLGYPNDNILFEDSQTAVLIQAGKEKIRVSMSDLDALDRILKEFIEYQRPEVAEFYQAIEQFKSDLPTIINTLRDLINKQVGWVNLNSSNTLTISNNKIAHQDHPNIKLQTKLIQFLNLCKDSINPNITIEDVREMMIQHILTEDIFLTIFDEAQFHRENNIARELTDLINMFLKGADRKQLLSSIQHYYQVIKSKASQINNHHEKQKFLKAIYENFYQAYNPLTADRLGIVYTPNEIVKFMIESTDYLLQKHFNKLLEDENVEILDPATGTGTFITELIEYLPKGRLKYKYKNEIHCNEVAILPYYIANLNIEYTYQQKMGEYEEFHNICFVDTFDHTSFEGKQMDLFAMSLENTSPSLRFREDLGGRKNDKKISVIIGNPPYNANQQNENDNNKNREYPPIDARIKATYVKESTAQKTKVYDMYARFFRWATDKLNDNGIIAFITNSSFINAKGFDGFRKLVNEEFSEIYIIDLDGDVRKNPKISGKTHNVFSIQTGVAISFMIKKTNNNNTPCKIFYTCRPDEELAIDKLNFLASHKLDQINFTPIIPDKNNHWINLAEEIDFDSLIPLVNKETKLAKNKAEEKAVFKLYSNGVVTARDEWVTSENYEELIEKILYFIEIYNFQKDQRKKNDDLDYRIKWSANLKTNLANCDDLEFNKSLIIKFLYRPFVDKFYYSEKRLSDRLTTNHYQIFSSSLAKDNIVIIFSGTSSSKAFSILATNKIFCLDVLEKTQCLPLYTYDQEGNRQENITDWSLEQFRHWYQGKKITKLDMFHYVYGVLHNPKYREKYELNLKREFPRIPFYDDFFKWVNWGKKLMELHLNYKTVKPYPLKRIDLTLTPNPSNPPNLPLKGGNVQLKIKLKADKIKGKIMIDDVTTLTEIPHLVWEYKLGNRSALEWILDQYKEKKPKDATIAEKFNNYLFADYKETVIDLLMRVTTVSVETMKIVEKMTHS